MLTPNGYSAVNPTLSTRLPANARLVTLSIKEQTSAQPDATGFHGFYYHFLDMNTGRRVWQCELSTVDTAFLVAGALAAAVYFDGATPEEQEIRSLADALYRRADWQWAQDVGETLTHGWKVSVRASPLETGGRSW